MSILYRVYSNDGAGGPLNYVQPIATTTNLSYVTSALAAPGDYRFAVRAYDTQAGREEANTEVRARIRLDAQGRDVTATPNAAFAVVARPTSAGGCRVSWAYSASGQGGKPTQFALSIVPDLLASTTPAPVVVNYAPGVTSYSWDFAALTDQASYTVFVRAQGNPAYLVSDPASAHFVADATAPDDVDALVATFGL